MSIKMDTKSIIIFVLFILLLLVGLKWYFTYDDNKDYKTRIDELHQENDSIIKARDSINDNLINLQFKYDSIAKSDSLLQEKIDKLQKDIENSKKIAEQSVKALNLLKKQFNELQLKIEELKKNPPFKTEEELLESIKNKL